MHENLKRVMRNAERWRRPIRVVRLAGARITNFVFHGRPFCLLPENIRTETATRAYRFVIVKDN